MKWTDLAIIAVLMPLLLAGCSEEAGRGSLDPNDEPEATGVPGYLPPTLEPLPDADDTQFILQVPADTDMTPLVAGLGLPIVDTFSFILGDVLVLLQGDSETTLEDFNPYRESLNIRSAGHNSEVRIVVEGGSGMIVFIGGEWGQLEDPGGAPFRTLDLPDVHAAATGLGALIGVIDTGADCDHPALVDHVDVLEGARLSSWESPPNGIDDDDDGYVDEGFGHGTFVSTEIALVAPEATILPIAALDEEGHGSLVSVLYALGLAAEHGCHIINLSLNLSVPSAQFESVLAELSGLGIAVVAAAGNEGTRHPLYPATSEQAIGVAAVDLQNQLAEFSGGGQQIGIAAPGVDILSAYPGGGYAKASGTSMATPVVSGAIALGMDAHGLNALTSVAHMRLRARPVSPSNATQSGLVSLIDLVTIAP